MGPVKAYAGALFSAAREIGKTEALLEELKSILQLFDTSEYFTCFLDHPIIPTDHKKNVIKAVLDQKISQEMENFIFLLIDKNRQNSLKEIFTEYSNLYRKSKQLLYAKVFTVVELEETEKQRLKSKLEEIFDGHIVIDNIVMRSVLGGMSIKIGHMTIDLSLERELTRMREQILRGEYV